MFTSSFNAALYDFSGSRAIGGSKLIVKSCDLLLAGFVLFGQLRVEQQVEMEMGCRHAYIILLKILWASFSIISPDATRNPNIYSTCFFSFSEVLPARIDAKLKCSCSTKAFGSTLPLPSISQSGSFSSWCGVLPSGGVGVADTPLGCLFPSLLSRISSLASFMSANE